MTRGRGTKQAFHSDNRTGYLNLDTATTYTYDLAKKWLSGIAREGSTSESAAYEYDPANGRLTRMDYGNGTHTDYTYYGSGAVKKISHLSTTGTLIASAEYDYDLAGNVLSVVLDDSLQYPGDATVSYTYDDLHRLTRETCVPSSGSYRRGYDYRYYYDAVGNRTASSWAGYSYSPRNELTRVTEGDHWKDYSYDLRGNLTETADWHLEVIYNEETEEYEYNEVYTGRRAFSWSSDDKLTRVEFYTYDAELDEDVLTKTVEYKYDLLGRRVAKRATYAPQEPGPWRWYFYDGLKVVAEGTSQNDKIYYTNSPGAIGGIICRDNNGTKLWYHFDRLGNVMAVTNVNGNMYAGYTMEAFGGVLEVGTSTGYYSSQSDPQPYHLTTKEYDPDTGLYYFNARWYDATTGRFLSRDRVDDGGSLYLLSLNNPLTFSDPTGMTVIIVGGTPGEKGRLGRAFGRVCTRIRRMDAAGWLDKRVSACGATGDAKSIADCLSNCCSLGGITRVLFGGPTCRARPTNTGYYKRGTPKCQIHICPFALDLSDIIENDVLIDATIAHELIHSCGECDNTPAYCFDRGFMR
jgi:RHS repeat-associated protein